MKKHIKSNDEGGGGNGANVYEIRKNENRITRTRKENGVPDTGNATDEVRATGGEGDYDTMIDAMGCQ